jgi:glycosyltransferase involved in cell wall biosynthesis
VGNRRSLVPGFTPGRPADGPGPAPTILPGTDVCPGAAAPGSGRAIKVLMIAEACGGGTGRHVLDLSEGLLERGYDVHLIHSSGRTVDSFVGHAEFRERLGRLRAIRQASYPMHRGIHPGDFSAVRWVRRYIREHGPFDIIHGHSAKGGALSRLAALGSDVRVFYTPHALVTMDPRLSPLKRLFYQVVEWALSKATDRIIAVSPEEQRHGIRFGLSRSRVILIPSGFEPVPFPPRGVVRRELCLPEDCRVVGFIGRLVEQKAPDVLIEAFATTANMLPQCRLVVVGSGPLKRSLRVMADLLGIANKVLWLGEHDGKCLLPAFDLLALPSRYEGLPLVTLEALSAGLPVVATASAGVELPVRHRHNGLIVPPNRPDLFAAALVELLSDPLKLEQFGRRSREISTEFTVRRMVDSTHEAYLDCMGMKAMEARPRPCEGVR